MGGGVVAEFFRDLQNPMRFSGGGVVAQNFSVTSKGHFSLMGPFFSFYFPEGGARAPWAPPPESATALDAFQS